MNKKGFTLAEILGVIVVISLLLLLIMPTIINRIAENSDKEVTYDLEKLRKIKDEYCDGLSHKVILGVRGEDISISKEGYPVKITLVELLGSESHIHVNFGNEIDDVAGNVVIKLLGRINKKVGDTINIQFKEEKMHFFDQETTNSIMERSFLNK